MIEELLIATKNFIITAIRFKSINTIHMEIFCCELLETKLKFIFQLSRSVNSRIFGISINVEYRQEDLRRAAFEVCNMNTRT